jgi:O-antigen/teichoic acid export membrane protein
VRFDPARLRTLLTYGGWIMVTTVVGPILTSADQFVVGGVLGTSAIAAYSIAFSLAVRLAIIPGALGQTMFPRLSRVTSEEAIGLTGQALRSIMLVMTAVCLPALLLARPFIEWWISPEFAVTAAPVTELLLIAMWINGLAVNPFMLLRARGRPDLTAKFHLLELIPYVIALYAGVTWFGLAGVALAGIFRVMLDTLLLYRASRLPLVNLALLPVVSTILLVALFVARSGALNVPWLIALAIVSTSLFALYMLRVDPLLRGWAVSLCRGVHPRMFA